MPQHLPIIGSQQKKVEDSQLLFPTLASKSARWFPSWWV